jgi:hypothetical protein
MAVVANRPARVVFSVRQRAFARCVKVIVNAVLLVPSDKLDDNTGAAIVAVSQSSTTAVIPIVFVAASDPVPNLVAMEVVAHRPHNARSAAWFPSEASRALTS